MKAEKVKPKELKMRDKVRLGDFPYADATVVQITDNEVKLFRPYVKVEDFDYTGGVLHSVGFEYVKFWKEDEREVDLIEHGKPERVVRAKTEEELGRRVSTRCLDLPDHIIWDGEEWFVVDAHQNSKGEYTSFTVENAETGQKKQLYTDQTPYVVSLRQRGKRQPKEGEKAAL